MSNNEDHIEKRIIETAKQLFVENGFDKTSMSDIATQVGINRPTLHYYFRTKEKLFQAVFGDIISKILPHVQSIFNQNIPFFNRLEQVVNIYLNVFFDNPMVPRFIINEMHRDLPHLVSSMRELSLDNYIVEIGKVIDSEMNQGNIRRIPMQILFLTLYSQLVFPFLTKKLTLWLFSESEEDFKAFLATWKDNLMMLMRALLEVKE